MFPSSILEFLSLLIFLNVPLSFPRSSFAWFFLPPNLVHALVLITFPVIPSFHIFSSGPFWIRSPPSGVSATLALTSIRPMLPLDPFLFTNRHLICLYDDIDKARGVSRLPSRSHLGLIRIMPARFSSADRRTLQAVHRLAAAPSAFMALSSPALSPIKNCPLSRPVASVTSRTNALEARAWALSSSSGSAERHPPEEAPEIFRG